VCAFYARVFGDQRARSPTAYYEHDWTLDPWIRGSAAAPAYCAGAITTIGESLLRPLGRLHFAGPDTSIEACSYLEGTFSGAPNCMHPTVQLEGLTNIVAHTHIYVPYRTQHH
jgi:monoamine oxidase